MYFIVTIMFFHSSMFQGYFFCDLTLRVNGNAPAQGHRIDCWERTDQLQQHEILVEDDHLYPLPKTVAAPPLFLMIM